MSAAGTPKIIWEIGTAYELFISLHVLHNPDEFGLRASWAAGVRSRLSPDDRKTLEEANQLVFVPFPLIYSLPPPKDAASALWALKRLEAGKRLPALCEFHKEEGVALQQIADSGKWDDSDLEAMREYYRREHKDAPPARVMTRILDNWAHSAEFGERLVEALQSYHQVFFAEEEERIATSLRQGLSWAQELAAKVSLPELFETLSQGIELQDFAQKPEIIFVPSFWSSPLVIFGEIGENLVVTFGVRPADASLVPGEVVPDALLLALKALADPTRLRILRYLTCEPLTQAQLARRLRLRPPTVTHHLKALRLARLVHFTLSSKDERQYSARLETIYTLQSQMKEFLEKEQPGESRG
jgi:DNA-binding transcriptional ArsR family regulator